MYVEAAAGAAIPETGEIHEPSARPSRSPPGRSYRLAASRGARSQRRYRVDRQPDRRRGRGCRDANRRFARAGAAGLVAGAMSMAAGEYVSVSSQSDTEQADLARERKELSENVEFEQEELADTYVKRGLDHALALQVAKQLMAKDALSAHARDELGISEITTARPIQAALTSAATFSVGAAMPLLMVVVAPANFLAIIVSAASLGFLAILGAIGAKAGGADIRRATARVTFWGAFAMALTAGIGRLFGTVV